jgi:DNA-binding MarR family transcriptional regulator
VPGQRAGTTGDVGGAGAVGDDDAVPIVRLPPEFERESPGASRLATECLLNMGYLMSRVEAHGEALARAQGIPSIPAFNVLDILLSAGQPVPPSTIAERMIITRGTVTSILHSLERHGLIRRRSHAADGRMRLVELTSEGASCAEALLPELHAAEQRWMACLTEDQQRTLLHLIALLQANAPEPPAKRGGRPRKLTPREVGNGDAANRQSAQ